MLAGVSVDYYLRLEQGRDIHPSEQVIDAIARALQLDEHATAHLRALGSRRPAGSRGTEPERAAEQIERLIDSWPLTPAFVHNRFLDVLAANALITALHPVFRAGANIVRATFLDPRMGVSMQDWEALAERNVARLRAMAGAEVDHPRLMELVDELSSTSTEFRRLWARHDVVVSEPTRYVLDHSVVGRLELFPVRLAVVEADGQFLIALYAQPGSASEHALRTLAQIAAGEDCP
jgi:hypothetical protein